MNIFTTFDISASALKAQRTRLNTISSNMANVETTSTPEGGPYKKKSVYFQSQPISFKDQFDKSLNGVKVTKIISDESEPKKIYDPSHPDAAEDGYVAMPNVSILKEITDMASATRSYEANATVIKSAKLMALTALEIGR